MDSQRGPGSGLAAGRDRHRRGDPRTDVQRGLHAVGQAVPEPASLTLLALEQPPCSPPPGRDEATVPPRSEGRAGGAGQRCRLGRDRAPAYTGRQPGLDSGPRSVVSPSSRKISDRAMVKPPACAPPFTSGRRVGRRRRAGSRRSRRPPTRGTAPHRPPPGPRPCDPGGAAWRGTHASRPGASAS